MTGHRPLGPWPYVGDCVWPVCGPQHTCPRGGGHCPSSTDGSVFSGRDPVSLGTCAIGLEEFVLLMPVLQAPLATVSHRHSLGPWEAGGSFVNILQQQGARGTRAWPLSCGSVHLV